MQAPNPRKVWTLLRLALLAALLLPGVALTPGGLAPAPAAAQTAADAAGEGPAQTPPGLFLPLLSAPEGHVVLTAQEKIYQRYAAGEIDYATYLLYRAYALYGDPRLPRELQGQIEEDFALLFELEDPAQPLSDAVLAQLQPYRVRPDHPDSVLNLPLPAPATTQVAASLPGSETAAAQAADFTCTEGEEGQGNWGKLASTKVPVAVHALCFNSLLDNTHTLPHMRLLLSQIEDLWGPMVAVMGAPLLDAGGEFEGGDSSIDFYLAYRREYFDREGSSSFTTADRPGFSGRTPPYVGRTSSGYVTIDRQLILNNDTTFMKAVVAHELFHVLQYAHNQEIMVRHGQMFWFNDASAEWAAQYFVPEAAHIVHSRFYGFQHSDLPLHAFGRNGSPAQRHNYEAYIWPFFMEQQQGPEAIAAAWDEIAKVDNWDAANAAIAKPVDFDASFRLFALRNLNNVTLFGDGIPHQYPTFDPAFPDGVMPPMKEEATLYAQPSPHPVAVSLPSLTADYYHYPVDEGVNQILITIQDVYPAEHLEVDAVVKLESGEWEVRQWSDSPTIQLCLDLPGQRITELYLVASNDDRNIDTTIEGMIEIHPKLEGCRCENLQAALANITGFEGTINFSFSASASSGPERLSISQQANLTTHLTPVEADSKLTFMDRTPQGSGQVDWVHTYDDIYFTDYHGAGQPIPYEYNSFSRTELNFDFNACTYILHHTLYVPGVGDSPSEAYVGSFSTARTMVNTGSMVLSGSGPFPVYSEDYIISQDELIAFFVDITGELTDWEGEGTHHASVNWSLQPIYDTGLAPAH